MKSGWWLFDFVFLNETNINQQVGNAVKSPVGGFIVDSKRVDGDHFHDVVVGGHYHICSRENIFGEIWTVGMNVMFLFIRGLNKDVLLTFRFGFSSKVIPLP